MNLWESELAPFRDGLDRLSPPQRLALAVKTLERAYWTEPEPFEDPEPERWLAGAVRAGRAAVADGASRITLPPALHAEFDTVNAGAAEPGVPQLLMAAVSCAESGSLKPDMLYSVLFSCYLFTMQRQLPEPLTPEEEEDNDRCREVIACHKELITQATAGA